MSYSTSRLEEKEGHLYYNVTISNPNLTSENPTPVQASFNETRSTPLLKNPSDYRISVTRFQCPGTAIPILVMPTEYDSSSPTNPNKTPFSVTLKQGSVENQVFLQWTTENTTVPIPPAPGINDPPIRPQYAAYYGMYNYVTMMQMFNTAFAAAFTGFTGTSTAPPIMVYDASTQLISIYCQVTYLPANDNIQIFFNSQAAEFFRDTLHLITIGQGTPKGKDVQLVIENLYTNFDLNPPWQPNTPWFQFQQQFVNIFSQAWTSLTQIVITSTFPTPQQISPNYATNSSVLQQSQSNMKPILTDLNVIGEDFHQGISYFPTAQYRYLDLMSNNPITSVAIDLFWQDSLNNLYPIVLFPNEQANLLILFEKLSTPLVKYK